MGERKSYAAFNAAGEVYAIGAADGPHAFQEFASFLNEVGGPDWQKIERLDCDEACRLHILHLDRILATKPKAA